ncbi:hypothetical protein DFJ74DRAFT_334854 [Hyaloraphidium curvatum]|nr:hypothetical protein DFJ74DRAFT_334854 [Hyaloraphidium curvatum]
MSDAPDPVEPSGPPSPAPSDEQPPAYDALPASDDPADADDASEGAAADGEDDAPDGEAGEESGAEAADDGDAEAESSSEEAAGEEEAAAPLQLPKKRKCPHLKAAVKIPRVKRLLGAKLKKGDKGIECNGCKKEGHTEPPSTLNVCLSCGAINCGRDSRSHALAHNTVLKHPVVAALNPSGVVWCYQCDEEVDAAPGINQSVLEARAMVRETLAMLDKGKSGKGVVIRASSVQLPPGPVKVEKPKGVAAPGLRNLGNTCFFNSTLQNLAYSQPLIDAMRPLALAPAEDAQPDGADASSPPTIYPASLTSSLATLLLSINDRARGLPVADPPPSPTSSRSASKYNDGSCDPRPFFSALSAKYRGYRALEQQDAHEMLRRSVDQMREEQVARIREGQTDEERKRFVRTFVDEVFGGYLASVVVCDVCRNVSWVREPYYDLSLSIGGAKEKEGGGKALGAFAMGSSIFSRFRLGGGDYEEKEEENEEGKEPEDAAPHPLSQDEKHLAYVEFLLRTVSIGAAPAEEGEGVGPTLERSLEAFMAVEELEGSEKIRCESCWKHLHSDWEEKAKAAQEAEAQQAAADAAEGAAHEPEAAEAAPAADGPEPETMDEPREDDQMRHMIDSGTFFFPQSTPERPRPAPPPPVKAVPKGPTKPGPVMRTAKKRYLILHPLPPVLVLHLKRFQQVGWRSQKISTHVSFPEILDVGGLCIAPGDLKEEGATETAAAVASSTRFRLRGVVVHMGGLHSGHYIAYVRVPVPPKEGEEAPGEAWVYASDTHVREASLEEALRAEAYLLFYERI